VPLIWTPINNSNGRQGRTSYSRSWTCQSHSQQQKQRDPERAPSKSGVTQESIHAKQILHDPLVRSRSILEWE
jgi:hypothetical protein